METMPALPKRRWAALRAVRALRDDSRATAVVETALILPVALLVLAMVIYGAEGFKIQRKVTLTARTVTDLITQATPTQFSSGSSVMTKAAIDSLLQVASAVLAPYPAANMTMVVSEVLVNAGGLTATVQWSEPYNGATVRAVGSTVTLPTGLGTGQQNNYFIMGEVYYKYTPLNFYTPTTAMTLHDTIYLTPRNSASINMLVGQ